MITSYAVRCYVWGWTDEDMASNDAVVCAIISYVVGAHAYGLPTADIEEDLLGTFHLIKDADVEFDESEIRVVVVPRDLPQ